MRIHTNTMSLACGKNLSLGQNLLSKSLNRLSTGLRINSAADDAAGLAISEKMRAQTKGLEQAGRNAQDGISMIQTAEGALNETHSILQRMRELSVQAANGTLTANDRQAITEEITQLKDNLDLIGSTTQFNRKNLLDGTTSGKASVAQGGTAVLSGNATEVEGDFTISVSSVRAGQGEVLQSGIFTLKTGSASGGFSPLSVNVMSLDAITDVDTTPVAASTSVTGGTALRDVANFWDGDRFLLDSPTALTLSQGDGRETSITLHADDTLEAVAEKISTAMREGLGQREMELDEPAFFVGDAGTEAPEGIVATIVDGLKSGWLEAAAKRIKDVYGLEGIGSNLKVSIYDKAEYGTLAAVSCSVAPSGDPALGRGTGHELHIDLQDFKPATGESGETISGIPYADRIIAHEMTHAIMSVNMNWSTTPTWFKEGTAEFLHGRNEQLETDMLANGAATGSAGAASTIMGSIGGGWDGSNENYSGAYTAVRFLHEKAVEAGHADGIKSVMADLATSSLDVAIANNTSYADASAFLTAASGAAGATFLQGLYDTGSLSDDADTGAIGGHDVDGGAVLDAGAVVDEGTASDFDGQPLSEFGWTVTWPDDLTAPAPNPSFDAYAAASSVDRAATPYTLSSTEGTLCIHSSIAGRQGELRFSGDEDVLKAFGFTTMVESEESVLSADIVSSDTGRTVQSGIQFSGRRLKGLFGGAVDIVLDPNTGVGADWNSTTERYDFTGGTSNQATLSLHLCKGGLEMQVGANEGDSLSVGFGEISVKALGLDNLSLATSGDASRAISLLDNAISLVSKQRNRCGAWVNRLEHSLASLATAGTNLTAAESRIRDVDFAREMMDFTRNNILQQAANSMLGQANQLPEGVLSLLR